MAHHIIPLDLTLVDGAQVSGQFFLFVAGDLTDGVVPEASNVTPNYFGDHFGEYTSPGRPKIAWRAFAVAGRQIWVDGYLTGEIFISDALERKFRRLGLAGQELDPAAIFAEKAG